MLDIQLKERFELKLNNPGASQTFVLHHSCNLGFSHRIATNDDCLLLLRNRISWVQFLIEYEPLLPFFYDIPILVAVMALSPRGRLFKNYWDTKGLKLQSCTSWSTTLSN